MISPTTIFVLALSVILATLYKPLESNSLFATQKPVQWDVTSKNILLVTAHPDDETMFFAPTILALQQKPDVNLFHVCLSNGNSEGLGKTRTKELENSLDILGIPQSMRWIVDHPDLQDNQTASWDANTIAEVLKLYVLDLKIDTFLTFDKTGVSSHPNHISIPGGATSLIRNLGETSSPLRLFTLVSTSLPLKYISILSVPLNKLDIFVYRYMQQLEFVIIRVLSIWYPEILTPAIPRNPDANAMPTFISGYEEYTQALEAMKKHESQLVWFRYLHIAFSRYMWVNSYSEVHAKA